MIGDKPFLDLVRDWTVRQWLIAAVVVIAFNVILAHLHN